MIRKFFYLHILLLLTLLLRGTLHALPNPTQDSRVQSIYSAFEKSMIWIENGAWTPCGKTLLEALSHVDEEGLWTEDYAPFLEAIYEADFYFPEEQKKADDLLTLATLNYITDMKGKRLDPEAIAREIHIKTPDVDETEILIKALSLNAGCGWIQDLAPSSAEYQHLKRLLALYRGQQPAEAGRIRSILVSLERHRWNPFPLPARYIQVNIPGFYLKAVDQGKTIFFMPVITGREYTKTPVFNAPLKAIVFNPSWHVPPSIARELLPKIRQNPQAYAAKGYHFYSAGGKRGIVQSPGNANALGKIRFTLENPFAIYLHGTPQKNLFHKSMRALSHGCIRVQDPYRLAAFVLQDLPQWSLDRIRREASGTQTRSVRLPDPLSVFITYFTAFEDENQKIRFVADAYGQDKKVYAALEKIRGRHANARGEVRGWVLYCVRMDSSRANASAVIPAKSGIQASSCFVKNVSWIPAYAGMTKKRAGMTKKRAGMMKG